MYNEMKPSDAALRYLFEVLANNNLGMANTVLLY
jgi:hypothetical protein